MFLSGVWHDMDGLIMDGGGCFGFLGEVVLIIFGVVGTGAGVKRVI